MPDQARRTDPPDPSDADSSDADSPDSSDSPAAPDGPEAVRAVDLEQPSRKLQRLEEEQDVAADFLEELLDIVDLDGDIDLDVEGDRATVSVVGGDLQRLVGTDGVVLDALQELTRLAVLQETGERSRLMLDVAGHRAQRRAQLVTEATAAAARVTSSGEPLTLAAMNSFERKVVHDTVAAAGLRSESEGEEPQRRVVVLPQA